MIGRWISIAVATLLACMACACNKAPSTSPNEHRLAKASAQAAAAGCEAPKTGWGSTTAKPSNAGPGVPNPDDCFFYKDAWQYFLFATQHDTAGKPSFINYPNLETLFTDVPAAQVAGARVMNINVRDVEPANTPPTGRNVATIGEGVRQAGGKFGIVVDGNGRPLFYSIYANDAYQTFLTAHNLRTTAGIIAATNTNKTLEFPAGVAEYKAAWAIASPGEKDLDRYITISNVRVPKLVQDPDGLVRVNGTTGPVTLKLLALHVAFTVEDHPEFIWATFEHLAPGGDHTDVAPSATTNTANAPIATVQGVNYQLFSAATPRNLMNDVCPTTPLSTCDPMIDHLTLDPVSQTFIKGGNVQKTTIFREFPGSKSDDTAIDDAIASLNMSVHALLIGEAGGPDVRSNYALVGAVWLEHPRTTADRKGDFVENAPFQNPPGQKTEDRSRMLTGEDRLSSTSMESFTQQSSPNCFSCHDTTKVHSDVTGRTLLQSSRLNVSHILSRHVEDVPAPAPKPNP